MARISSLKRSMKNKNSSGDVLQLSIELIGGTPIGDERFNRGSYIRLKVNDERSESGLYLNWYTMFNRNPIFVLFTSLIGLFNLKRIDINNVVVCEEIIERFYIKRK